LPGVKWAGSRTAAEGSSGGCREGARDRLGAAELPGQTAGYEGDERPRDAGFGMGTVRVSLARLPNLVTWWKWYFTVYEARAKEEGRV
jgi:hypothetical protein